MSEEVTTWMVYLANDKWLVPTRPTFVIKGTAEELTALTNCLEHSRGYGVERIDRDTRVTFSPVTSFESVQEFQAARERRKEHMRDQELTQMSYASFL